MTNKAFTLLSFVSIGTLIYYLINGGKYNTIFLPVLEGAITVGLILLWLMFKKVKNSFTSGQITYAPVFASLFILFSVIVFNIAFNSFGSERIVYIGESKPLQTLVSAFVQITFLPLGGLGIPLGMFISFIWPLLSLLGTLTTTVMLLLIPASVGFIKIKKLLSLVQSQNSNNYLYFYLIYPVLILSFIIPLLFILSYMRVQSVVIEENTWQVNSDSYENGKKIQHALEGSVYRGGEYYETFPSSLDKLVEWNLIDEIPLSPVENRAYIYTLDPDGKNYTICFPQTEGERCERSWSR